MEFVFLICKIVAIVFGVLFFIKFTVFKKSEFLFTLGFVGSLWTVFITLLELLSKTKIIIAAIVYILICLILFFIYFLGKGWFRKYRKMLIESEGGLKVIDLASIILLAFSVVSAVYVFSYESSKYIYIYIMQCITIIAVYLAFIISLYYRRNLNNSIKTYEKDKKWYQFVYMDSLTKVNNRLSYDERIKELEKTANDDSNVYLIVVDIDRFKEINDEIGHQKGDEALEKTAASLTEIFDDDFEIYRIGGDEFVVIGSGVSEEKVKEKLFLIDSLKYNPDFGLVLSYGYAHADFEYENAMETAFVIADKSMYRMKKAKNALR